VDILVNNASSLGPTPLRLLLDTECEDLEHVLSVNVVGPFRLTKIVAGSMALRGTGTVVNISSDAAVSAYGTWGSYSASKAAQDHLTRIWAEELAGVGVRFIAVDPGEMNTQMHADALPDANTDELADPRAVADTIVAMCRDTAEARSGTRLVAPEWKVGHEARA
jgi:NAD(P)-dependent dehydrogenase (short-subunit alcohol dehydrogenase family)